MNDTIATISTALGVGAISIIRVTGEESIEIVNKITKYKKLDKVKSHTINYDYIIDDNELIDEVLISVMKAPKTFTKEDIIEINCHGGISTTNKILQLLLLNGCRLAEKGEFTKRAFLNGRIDLIEAEGIMNIIGAPTENSRKIAVNELSGKTSNLIKQLRQKIVEIIANIEVNIDYPEYEDIEEMTNSIMIPKITEIEEEIKKIIHLSENEKYVREGIKVALIGKPNVGKSSLLNCLLEENKAIVTDIPGTTRDFVEGYINMDGFILNIIDSAGIRKTEDIVEKIGVEKSKKLIEESDLVLFLLNNNEETTNEEKEILKLIEKKEHIIVINKNDLETKIDENILNSEFKVNISAINNIGIDDLKSKIKQIFNLDRITTTDLNSIVNARAVSHLKKTIIYIEEVKKAIHNNLPVDMVEIDLKNIWNTLGLIIGATYEDELIDQLFSQFCLGK